MNPGFNSFFIGLLIYLLYSVFAEQAAEETDKTIVVSAGEIEWMNVSWQKRWNRPPTAEELECLVQQYIKETVLYREALTMGLNQHDTVIRHRLAQKLEFLARDLAAMTPPAEEELQTYFNEHQSIYQEPARFTFTQVFIDPDKRGDGIHGRVHYYAGTGDTGPGACAVSAHRSQHCLEHPLSRFGDYL